MTSTDRGRILRPSFTERHRVTASLLVLLGLVSFAALTAGALASVLVRLVGVVTGMVGGGS